MTPKKLNGHADRMIWAIRKIIRTVAIHSRQLAVEHNVTGPQLSTLNALHRKDELTVTEIANILFLSPSTIVGVLDRLEEKGYITRRRDTADRRRVLVQMTDDGKKLVKEVPHPLEDSLIGSLAKIPEKEKGCMADALERLVELIGAEDTSADPLDDIEIQSLKKAGGSSRGKSGR